MRVFLLGILCFLVGSASSQSKVGLLLMAHGGTETWNEAVEESVASLRADMPVSIAFGMANPVTLQTALDDLVSQGAESVAVVRLFVSGESFLKETAYSFQLEAHAPSGHTMHKPRVLDLSVPVSLSVGGLLDAQLMAGILVDRALGLSLDPSKESILIVGHGPGDDDENKRWVSKMDHLAESIRKDGDFHSVNVSTLREDWTGKREAAELELQAFVRTESTAGRTVIIIPFRLFGFGPYADVFEGLSYRADSLGLLPDQRVTDWIRSQYMSTKETLIQSEMMNHQSHD